MLAELKVRYPQGGTSGAPGADFPVLVGSTDDENSSSKVVEGGEKKE